MIPEHILFHIRDTIGVEIWRKLPEKKKLDIWAEAYFMTVEEMREFFFEIRDDL